MSKHSLLSRRKKHPGRDTHPTDPNVKMPEPTITPPSPQPTSAPIEHDPALCARVTFIIVNFKTKALTRDAVTTLQEHYSVRTVLIDNGSGDASTREVVHLGNRFPAVTAIQNADNVGHGPALHQGTKLVETEFFFALDSDCIVKRGGFLEAMLARLDADSNLYATGWLRSVDRLSGVPREWHTQNPPGERFIPYAHPAATLYRTAMYRRIAAFAHHGAPVLANMNGAKAAGFTVTAFPIFDYIEHLEAGTRRMYGGRWDPKLGEKPKQWNRKERYPI